MEIIVVLVLAAIVLAVAIIGVGSLLGRPRGTDELRSERGAGRSEREGAERAPTRDRPAGPGAESQDPGLAGGELHPPEQQGAPAEDSGLPSEAAGKHDPEADGAEEGRSER